MSAVAAIVVTHNNGKTIKACLESLIHHGITSIVVVDNASTDDTTTQVRAYPVRLVKNKKNTGFAAAVNTGVQSLVKNDLGYWGDSPGGSPGERLQAAEAVGRGKSGEAGPRHGYHFLPNTDYLLFFNPDAVLQDSLDPATTLLENNKHIGIVGLGLYDNEGNVEKDSFGQEPNLFNLFVRKLLSVSYPAAGRDPAKGGGKLQATSLPDWVSGGAMFIRASLFHQLHGFDEAFFLYWEDIDLCRRAREAGFHVNSMPSIHVIHGRGVSLTDRRKKAALYDQSADRYFQKHYAAPIWIFQRLLRFLYRLFWPEAR